MCRRLARDSRAIDDDIARTRAHEGGVDGGG
jgi:hypothetical protein